MPAIHLCKIKTEKHPKDFEWTPSLAYCTDEETEAPLFQKMQVSVETAGQSRTWQFNHWTKRDT